MAKEVSNIYTTGEFSDALGLAVQFGEEMQGLKRNGLPPKEETG